MINVVKKTIIIFIDHATNFSISNQTIISSDNINKLSSRLVKASTYLLQFDLNVKYKIEKSNVVSNALSRFFVMSDSKDSTKMNALNLNTYYNSITIISNTIHVFQETLISITDDFKRRFIEK